MNTLKQIIDDKGYKLSYVASELSLTREALYKKLRGDTCLLYTSPSPRD